MAYTFQLDYIISQKYYSRKARKYQHRFVKTTRNNAVIFTTNINDAKRFKRLTTARAFLKRHQLTKRNCVVIPL